MTPDEKHEALDNNESPCDVHFESSLSLGTQEGGQASGGEAH